MKTTALKALKKLYNKESLPESLTEAWAECSTSDLPKFIQFMDGADGREKSFLLEGLNYVITDPNEEAGLSLWKDLFAPHELLSDDGKEKTYKWHALDQIINLGDVASMVKYNVCADYIDTNSTTSDTAGNFKHSDDGKFIHVKGPLFEPTFMQQVAGQRNATLCFKVETVDMANGKIIDEVQECHAGYTSPKNTIEYPLMSKEQATTSEIKPCPNKKQKKNILSDDGEEEVKNNRDS